MLAKIPLAQIERAGIYVNTGKKSLAQVKKETGADYLINAGHYHMKTFVPVNHLVVGGKVLSKSLGKTGYSFNGSKIVLAYDNWVNYPDHVSCVPLLVKEGKLYPFTTPAGTGGYRPRSVIGLSEDSFYMATFGSCTFAGAAQAMLRYGCVSAGAMDGGDSTQADFNGERVLSKIDRRVHNYLCVWLKKPEPIDPADSWAAEAWNKANRAGVMDGTRPKDGVARQELAVMFDRLGLL